MARPPERRGGSRMRMLGLMRKEFLQIVRDPSSIAIAFVMPVALLLLFGYGVSLDARHIPLAMVIQQPGGAANAFAAEFSHTPYFKPQVTVSLHKAYAWLDKGQVDGVIVLRSDFNRRVRVGRAHIQVITNGVDANRARIIQGYVRGAWSNWLEHRARLAGGRLVQPVDLQSRVWFNAGLRSRNYLVPGLVVVIMTLIGALLTSMVMAREWERGTLEALMVTPVTAGELVWSKLVPYFVLGMGGMALTVSMAVTLFAVPLRGSVLVLLLGSMLFLLAALGMGLLISVTTRNQFVAGLAAIITTFLPAFLLSGFIFDIGSMPAPVRWITHLIAARYLVAILQSVFLAGDVWSVILPNALALALMALLFLGMVRLRLRKRLD